MFDDERIAYASIQRGEVVEGMVVVVRYEGPSGSPGMAVSSPRVRSSCTAYSTLAAKISYEMT